MDHGFGIERPGAHVHAADRDRAKYLVLIEAAGSVVALLFTERRELVSHIDGGSEEVALMTRGLPPPTSAASPEWDEALAGHSDDERAAGEVFTLDI